MVGAIDVVGGTVKFLAVDTWFINGIQIGRCKLGQKLEKKDLPNVRLHPQFEQYTTRGDLKRVLFALVGGTLDEQDAIEPVALPTKPERLPEGLNPSTSPEAVEAVIVIMDKTVPHRVYLVESDLQTTHRRKESYDDFVRFILHTGNTGEDDFKGLFTGLKNKSVPWDIDVWVLPQVEGSPIMYNWTRLSHLTAESWLNKDLHGKFGSYIYIEVRVIVDEGALAEKAGEAEEEAEPAPAPDVSEGTRGNKRKGSGKERDTGKKKKV